MRHKIVSLLFIGVVAPIAVVALYSTLRTADAWQDPTAAQPAGVKSQDREKLPPPMNLAPQVAKPAAGPPAGQPDNELTLPGSIAPPQPGGGGGEPLAALPGESFIDVVPLPDASVVRRKELEQIEASAEALAQEYRQVVRTKGLSGEQQKVAREKLSTMLKRAFELRHLQQVEEAQKLEKRLKEVQATLQKREKLADQIVQRRLEELLQDRGELEWDPTAPRSAVPDNPNSAKAQQPGGLPGMGTGLPGKGTPMGIVPQNTPQSSTEPAQSQSRDPQPFQPDTPAHPPLEDTSPIEALPQKQGAALADPKQSRSVNPLATLMGGSSGASGVKHEVNGGVPESKSLRERVSEARANLRKAQAELEPIRKAAASQAVSQLELRTAQLAVEAAESLMSALAQEAQLKGSLLELDLQVAIIALSSAESRESGLGNAKQDQEKLVEVHKARIAVERSKLLLADHQKLLDELADFVPVKPIAQGLVRRTEQLNQHHRWGLRVAAHQFQPIRKDLPDSGVRVTQVDPDSLADKAKLQVNDILIGAAGFHIRSEADLDYAFVECATTHPAEPVKLFIVRGDMVFTVTIEFPSAYKPVPKPAGTGPDAGPGAAAGGGFGGNAAEPQSKPTEAQYKTGKPQRTPTEVPPSSKP